MVSKLIIATRKSQLALWQANYVKQLLLEKHPTLSITLNPLSSEGDEKNKVPLNEIGGKDLFVKKIQHNVLNNKAQMAVHSLKDMSAHDHADLILAAFLKRADPRDAFVSVRYKTLADLPSGAVIGTASPRRRCLLNAIRPDLQITLLRGNVPTRLEKLDNGEYDAIILAAAGLQRLNLAHRITAFLDPQVFIPAIGQGIIVAECQRNDNATQDLLNAIDDPSTRACAIAERAFNQKLNGDCFTPLGALATAEKDQLHIIGFYGDLSGKTIIRAKQSGPIKKANALGWALAEAIIAQQPEQKNV